ncbi:hypothetical protein TRVA0_016S01552 [Trichomonascus vanleenenianus]|uniref:uncharacterized protein n=1 Tax=Trichomonascus vanleenenianus TaxID=2268995 RepID=UPI003ECAF5A2
MARGEVTGPGPCSGTIQVRSNVDTEFNMTNMYPYKRRVDGVTVAYAEKGKVYKGCYDMENGKLVNILGMADSSDAIRGYLASGKHYDGSWPLVTYEDSFEDGDSLEIVDGDYISSSAGNDWYLCKGSQHHNGNIIVAFKNGLPVNGAPQCSQIRLAWIH